MDTKLVDLISQQNADAFKEAFEEALASRVADALETKKIEVAQSLFDEEVEQVDEVNSRHSFTAAQQALTPRAKNVKAALGTTNRDKAATKKYARRIAKISGDDYSKKDVVDNLKSMGEEVEQIDEVGVMKKVGRAISGWGAFDKDKPKDVVKNTKSMSNDALRKIAATKRDSFSLKKSPAALQQKVAKRELEKRSVSEEDALKARQEWIKAKGVSTGNPKADRARKVKRLMQTFPLKKEEAEQVDEKAPAGAKYERMVKHIKKQYSKDGVLTGKEKAIAYATAWKAKNKAK